MAAIRSEVGIVRCTQGRAHVVARMHACMHDTKFFLALFWNNMCTYSRFLTSGPTQFILCLIFYEENIIINIRERVIGFTARTRTRTLHVCIMVISSWFNFVHKRLPDIFYAFYIIYIIFTPTTIHTMTSDYWPIDASQRYSDTRTRKKCVQKPCTFSSNVNWIT